MSQSVLQTVKEIEDTRKIACISDYFKIYEGFLKTWILEDISQQESFSQFGGKQGPSGKTIALKSI